MVKNVTAIFVVMGIIDGMMLIAIILAYQNDIVPGKIASILILLLFAVTAFVSAALLDLLEPIFKTLGEIFESLGGFLGR